MNQEAPLSRIQQLAVLAQIIKETHKILNTNIGRLRIQKIVSALQSSNTINLGYKFKQYYYGPWCEDLWSDLWVLEDWGYITIKSQPCGNGYAYTISPTGQIDNITIKTKKQLTRKDVIRAFTRRHKEQPI